MTETVTFYSRSYPAGAGRTLAFARSIVQPTAVSLLPVMIVTLVAVLEGQAVFWLLLIAFPAGMILATVWTSFQIRRVPAEILVRGSLVAVRSVWESAGPGTPKNWLPLYDVRDYGSWILVTVGDESHQLNKKEWPEHAALVERLRSARQQRLAGIEV